MCKTNEQRPIAFSKWTHKLFLSPQTMNKIKTFLQQKQVNVKNSVMNSGGFCLPSKYDMIMGCGMEEDGDGIQPNLS